MSIIYNNEELEQAPYTDVGKAECAYCDFILTFPCLFWMTAKGQGLFAHHTCARQWVKGLIKDVHTLDALINNENRSHKLKGKRSA